MDKKRVAQIKEQFDLVIHNNGTVKVEYWYARELMPLLGYERWENFDKAISRAMDSCETSGIEVSDHFREVTKMISLAKGAKREVKDYMLTRFACYLIAQNGDPKKDTTEDMKLRLGIKSTRPLADFLPTLTIAAKNLATEVTNYNVEQKDLYGEQSITAEHVQNNVSVRQMLGQRGIKPENLPPAEDIKKVERRVASNEKKIEKTSNKLPKKVDCH